MSARTQIENPRIVFDGESMEYATCAAMFERGDSRFHIWLDRDTGKAKLDSPLYKNPRVATEENRLTRTQQLDPDAKINRALLAELWERVDFAATRAAYAVTLERKARIRAAERIEAAGLAFRKSLFDVPESELVALMDSEKGRYEGAENIRERAQASRAFDLLCAIHAYRFRGV